MTTIREAVDRYAADHPNFFMIAGDHEFSCMCPNCVTFLATTGLDYLVRPETGEEWGDPDPVAANQVNASRRHAYRTWQALAAELPLTDFATDGLTGHQAATFHDLAVDNL